jgi:1-phosphatidylinositol-3-phosphate 5-kinase
MASKNNPYPPSPSTSSMFLPLGRRGSVSSLSSQLLDKESLSQHLDQIHSTASQAETLTTFNDFAKPPSSSSGPDGKTLAGELVQSGISGLYSRMRGVVGGVRDRVEMVVGSPDGSSINSAGTRNPQITIPYRVSNSRGSNTATSSPMLVSMPTSPRMQSPVMTSFSTVTSTNPNQTQKVSVNASTASTTPSTVSGRSTSVTKSQMSEYPESQAARALNFASYGASSSKSGKRPESSTESGLQIRFPSDANKQGATERSEDSLKPTALSSDSLSRMRQNLSKTNSSDMVAEFAEIYDDENSEDDDYGVIAPDDDSEYRGRHVSPKSYHRDVKSTSRAKTDKAGTPPGGRSGTSSSRPPFLSTAANNKSKPLPPLDTSALASRDQSAHQSITNESDSVSVKSTIMPKTAMKRMSLASRISESHLPNFKRKDSEDSGTPESSPAPSTLNNDYDDELSPWSDGAADLVNSPANGSSSKPPDEVSGVLKQLRSGVLSKDFWMKDENCKECFLCQDTFSAWRRKHHCSKLVSSWP